MAPLHEFEPVYVPVMDDDEAWPSPETLAVHDANGLSNPPAGTVIENESTRPTPCPRRTLVR